MLKTKGFCTWMAINELLNLFKTQNGDVVFGSKYHHSCFKNKCALDHKTEKLLWKNIIYKIVE